MLLTEAVNNRITNLCREHNITINKLCTMAGVTQSTVDSIIKGKSKNPNLRTIFYLCQALNMTIPEFFNHPDFFQIDDE